MIIINQTIVTYGQELHGQASQSVRADSFVIETNIHHPTESSLIYDGVRKIVPLCVILATELDQPGWRQADHLVKQIKNDGLDRVDGTSPCSELS